MALSYAELDVAYRAALRRIVQVTAERDRFEGRLLIEQARHTRSAQRINEDIERFHRDRQQQQAGHETERIAHEARPAISLTD